MCATLNKGYSRGKDSTKSLYAIQNFSM